MDTITDSYIGNPEICPYLHDRTKIYRYYYNTNLTQSQMNDLLTSGWRHFGYTFFQPACPNCNRCIPIRIKTSEFLPSKNQRRTLQKNKTTRVFINELSLTGRIYTIYENHSIVRFNTIPSVNFLLKNILEGSTASYQVEYYYHNILFAVDFIDETHEALNSIYCIFHSNFSKLRPGIFSILYEIELAKQKDLPYFYLGYYVPGCSVMEYKISFHPYQWYCWKDNTWHDEPAVFD